MPEVESQELNIIGLHVCVLPSKCVVDEDEYIVFFPNFDSVQGKTKPWYDRLSAIGIHDVAMFHD